MYHIIITTDIEREILTERRWAVVGEEAVEGSNELGKKYDYIDQVPQTVIETIKVLEQSVEELDLPKVIAAINGLELKDG